MSYADDDPGAESSENSFSSGTESESESVQRQEFYGHHTSGGAAAGERRAATQLWLISYSDFMTILLVFFLVMYGYTYLAKAALFARQARTNNFSAFTNIVHGMKGELGKNMEIMDDVEKMTIQLKDQVLFPSGASALSPEARKTLAGLADSLKLVSGAIVVEGHTDNVPVVGGPYASNWELSAARAFSVIDALTQAGVSAERLSAWGFGPNRPLASNENPEGRARNRRINIVVFKKAK